MIFTGTRASDLRASMTMAALTVAILATAGLTPASAEAQCAAGQPCSEVSPTGKGMVGLGLIGVELGFVIPALVQDAANTDEWWPYLVFPLIGAAVGITGGYFMEEATRADPEVDVAFLAIGLALVVPATVLTLALTAYDPGSDTSGGQASEGDQEPEPSYEDESTSTEAVQEDDGGGGGSSDTSAAPPPGPSSSIERRMDSVLAGGPGLLRFDGQGRQILLGLPIVRRIATYSAREVEALRLVQTSDIEVPLVSGTF